jgi:hypothetical protein
MGGCSFTDSIDRDVYEDAEGRQYVQDDNDGKAYGTWLSPADEPDVVE